MKQIYWNQSGLLPSFSGKTSGAGCWLLAIGCWQTLHAANFFKV
jgi:hypothetical protein